MQIFQISNFHGEKLQQLLLHVERREKIYLFQKNMVFAPIFLETNLDNSDLQKLQKS
jgi:hypothetical protein